MQSRATFSAPEGVATDLRFSLNGAPVILRDVDPRVLLVDWLRSPDVGLTGTKIGCKQGGCGACTVVLSRWNEATGTVEHESVNSCMRPLAALDGMLVTTIEGTGSVKADCISQVQQCIALNNGTQCGYCTPGWVMNMTAAVAQRGPKPGTKVQIEELFDGNLCRCTGYRPILYGFKKDFASDWNPAIDERGCMVCEIDPAEQVSNVAPVCIAFPAALQCPPRAVAYAADGCCWLRPVTLEGLLDVLALYPDRADVRLVGGNTSIGVYPRTVEDPHVFIDISHVASLQDLAISASSLHLGAGLSYRKLIEALDAALAATTCLDPAALPGLQALRYMAGRTAGTIVRNAATLAGNTMMVVRHANEGVPFPSDCFTALASLGTRVSVLAPGWMAPQSLDLLDFAAQWQTAPSLQAGCVLLSYDVPLTTAGEFAQTYKTALRDVNAHSIVNAGLRVRLDANNIVVSADLVFGGLSPVATHLPQTEAVLFGAPWTALTLQSALAMLRQEVGILFERYAERYADLPDEGFSLDYKLQLAEAYLYKFFVEVLEWRGLPVPPEVRSAGERSERPASRGTQSYVSDPAEYPASLPIIKIEALLQATGEAIYTHDIALPRRGLNGAAVQSTVALGTCVYAVPGVAGPASPAQVLAEVQRRHPSVIDYITAIDVPGPVLAGTAVDDPLFAISVPITACPGGHLPTPYDTSAPVWLSGFGQCIGMVVAENEQIAQDAAWYVQQHLCNFTAQTPVIDLPDTDAARNALVYADNPAGASWYSHIWQITRAGTQLAWVPPRAPDQPDLTAPVVTPGVQVSMPGGATPKAVSSTLVSSAQKVGSQIHFYMETQSSFVEVLEDRQILAHASTQDANAIQGGIARVLELPLNKVDVRVKRVGGGYGGKCGQSVFASSMAAVAAWKLNRSVRLASLRQVDTAMFGHRHPALANYNIAIGDASEPAMHGLLTGFQADYWLDGGRTYDCSFIISDCLSLRSDSAYMIPNWNCVSDVCRTNKTTNTSMRTVGMIQAAVFLEDAVEAAAHSVGLPVDVVRERNLYRPGQTTPYGEPLLSCYMREVWDYTVAQSDFQRRKAEVEAFNTANRWRKRGISLIPVKYGSGFNLTMLEQGGALIEVYDQDGSVLVRHGGIEMGQGLNTKIAQIVGVTLNVPMGIIRVAENDTAVVPNPESTGASTGTSFNGEAAQQACDELRFRLELFCAELLKQHGQTWCHDNGVDFWSYPEGWRATVPGKPQTTLWQSIVSKAFEARLNLSAQARVAVPGGGQPDSGLTFKTPQAQEPVDYFNGYTFSAACTEVEVDVLTGVATILRSDVVYDAGQSLNPAVDVGQVEGGFIQGLGYVTSEALSYQPAGTPTAPSPTRPAPGALYTVNTWEYKPPAAQCIPLELNVMLFPRGLAPAAPDPGEVLSSKEIGEPPMTLAVSAFFAIKQAVLAARRDRGHNEWFQLDAPATVQQVREACLVDVSAASLLAANPPQTREAMPAV